MSAPSLSQSSPTLGNTPAGSSQVLQRLKSSFAGNLSGASLNSAMLPTDTVLQNTPVVQPAANQVLPTPPQVTETLIEPTTTQQPVAIPEPEPIPQPEPEPVVEQTPTLPPAPVDTLNVPYAGSSTAKEALPSTINISVEHPAIDTTGGVQYVETERPHEMPLEVEGFLKTVENHHDQIPQEIVISDPQTGQSLPRVMAQPVIVLPITAKVEKDGKWKQPTHSVRWLIEWSWKVMKMFSGKVVYRNAELS